LKVSRPVRVPAVPAGSVDAATADYSDGVAIDVSDHDDRSTEQWARSALEGSPVALRLFIVTGWRLVLRLRLGPRHSPDHVLGWTIAHRVPDETVLLTRSPWLTAHLVFRRDDSRLVWSTFVHYQRPIAAWIWPPVSLLHRQVVPYALGKAAANSSP
jgi:hypothetical protein